MTPKSAIPPARPPAGHPSLERVEELGIVGAGRGGFPTAVKLSTRVSVLIANAVAEDGMLVGRGVIPAPSPELFREYI